jgi:hypothetical protein
MAKLQCPKSIVRVQSECLFWRIGFFRSGMRSTNVRLKLLVAFPSHTVASFLGVFGQQEDLTD